MLLVDTLTTTFEAIYSIKCHPTISYSWALHDIINIIFFQFSIWIATTERHNKDHDFMEEEEKLCLISTIEKKTMYRHSMFRKSWETQLMKSHQIQVNNNQCYNGCQV